MEFQDVVRRRRMHRRFDGEPVPPRAVDRMLGNAVRAPNAGFSQGWAFVVADDAEARARFWTAATPPSAGARSDRDMSGWLAGMRTAPVIVLVLTSKAAYLRRYAERDKGWADLDESRWPVPFWHVDAGMAALLILQTAVDEGLGACFFGVPPARVQEVRSAFTIPGEFEITGAIAVGHPATGGAAGSPGRRRRKPLSDVVFRGRFTATDAPG
ncbi:nitroreductase family protein [Myceligenerans crystallogenes]|uniref:Nitroreductase domain-containing protein n=1 Tax=Myceligenerans crystallogenes TaxID=316335 RepID=A0ABN2NCW2_9MICO